MNSLESEGQIKAIYLSEKGIREWLWETLMVDGKILFDIPENKSVFWGIMWYPDSVLIAAFDEESSWIVKNFGEAHAIIKEQLPLAPTIFHSGQEGDENKTPYCVISASDIKTKLSTIPPTSTMRKDYIFGSSKPIQGTV